MSDTLLAPSSEELAAVTWTQKEIEQQPHTLRATQALLRDQQAAIEAFLAPLLARPDLRIVLTGAGTSAFIGECLAPVLSRALDRCVEAIATTDIVSSPDLYLRADEPTLLVSFGRSGSSPESVAAVDLLDAHVRDAHHLIVTCNAEGHLAGRAGAGAYVLILPEETHDRAFAMTSSFSAMMLAALSSLGGIAAMDARVPAIADAVAEVPAFGSNGKPVRYVASWSYYSEYTRDFSADNTGLSQFNQTVADFGATSDDGGYIFFGSKNEERNSSTIALSRAFAGAAYQQLDQRGFTTEQVTFRGLKPTPGDAPGRATFTASIGGGFTVLDPVQSTANRSLRLALTRGFSLSEGVIQRLSIVAIEE